METSTTTDIRRRNLRIVIKEAGGYGVVAIKINISSVELKQMTDKFSQIKIGSWLARDIEDKLGLETDWLDMSHEFLPDEARLIAKKWLILPSNIRMQIKDYMDLQIESLQHEQRSDYEEEEEEEEKDDTDLSAIYK